MKAFQTTNPNILKTMKTLNYFLQMALSILLHLFNTLLTLFFRPEPSIQQSNTPDNILKQQPTQFLTLIPSLQFPFPLLSASQARRENPSSLPSRSLPSPYLPLRSAPFNPCAISPISIPSIKPINQSTGPPISARHPFPSSSSSFQLSSVNF